MKIEDLTWREYNRISDVAKFYRDNSDKIWRLIFHTFVGIPANPFRRLIGIIIFQEVMCLYYQNNFKEAIQIVNKFEEYGKMFWGDGSLEIIKSGRLIPVKCK